MEFAQFDQGKLPIGYQISGYKCTEILGQGSFGKIYKGISKKDENLVVALKVISKRKIKEEKSERIKLIKEKLIKSEVEIMQKCNSDYVIKCYDKFENEDVIIFILEYCNDKDLYQHIRTRKTIPEEQAIRILKHIINGFAELHKINVIHRDLKSQNVFKHNQKYKIGDMGFAKVISGLYEINQGTVLGTLNTMAPEILKRGKYGIKADLWSLGIVFYQMLIGKPPFSAFSAQGMQREIENRNLNLNDVSEEARDLINQLLTINPDERISWKQLYKHPIFYKYKGSIFLDEFQEDVSLQNSQKIHEKLQQKKEQINIVKQLDEIEQKQSKPFPAPNFKKQKDKEIKQDQDKLEKLQEIDVEIKGYIERLNFQKDKSLMILEEIIQPIYKKLGFKKDRSLYEFLYLVSSRALFIVSPIFNALKQRKNVYDWKYYEQFLNSNISAVFFNDFNDHYKKVYDIFKQMDQKNYEQESKISSRIFDFLKKTVDKQNFQKRDKFFCGIQGIDFQMRQQIQFTNKEYIRRLMKDIQYQKDYSNTVKEKNMLIKLKAYLENYQRILLASFILQKNILKEIRLNNQKKQK